MADESKKRNILREAARIARGNINELKILSADNFDALFMPGGFGAAKNLSNFAFKGKEMEVEKDVAEVIKEFHAKKKHIGLICISPILAAKVLGSKSGGAGINITLGKKNES